MLILPAIDLKDGRCVRLVRGDFATAGQVADDPLAVAADFARSGAVMLHMVDLDGARSGVRANADIIASVCKSSGLAVELGGGLRSMADLDAADAMGVRRFVIGSAAVSDPDLVAAAVEKYGARVAVGVDARNGLVMTHGWERGSDLRADEFAKSMAALGVGTLIYTDIDTDGTLFGPPLAAIERLVRSVDASIVASGGVGCVEDVRRVRETGAAALIIGKGYYSGAVDLADAVRTGGAQCIPNE